VIPRDLPTQTVQEHRELPIVLFLFLLLVLVIIRTVVVIVVEG